MVEFRAQCPKCQSMLKIDKTAIGKTKRCPKCKELIQISSDLQQSESHNEASSKIENGLNKKYILVGSVASISMLFVLLLIMIAIFGHNDKDKVVFTDQKTSDAFAELDDALEKQKNTNRKSIEYAYKTWKYVGPFDQRLDDSGDIFRLSMKADLYTEGEPKKRLLELTPLEDEKVYSRILRVQIRPEDRWLSHGTGASWMLDGSRSEIQYSLGRQHGMQREWFPNGQLKLKRHWHYDEVLAQKEWDIDGKLVADVKNNPNYKWSSKD